MNSKTFKGFLKQLNGRFNKSLKFIKIILIYSFYYFGYPY